MPSCTCKPNARIHQDQWGGLVRLGLVDDSEGTRAPRKWVEFCANCGHVNINAFASDTPIYCVDGVVRCAPDFGNGTPVVAKTGWPFSNHAALVPANPGILTFRNLLFTRNALYAQLAKQYAPPVLISAAIPATQYFPGGMLSQMKFTVPHKPTILDVEEFARHYMAHPSSGTAARFAEAVFYWGGGANRFKRAIILNKEQNILGAGIDRNLSNLRNGNLCPSIQENAINDITAVRGIGVSFGSKILRMLDPSRFPVLDAVLARVFGYSLDSNGYRDFSNDLLNFLAHHPLNCPHTGALMTAGAFEASLFLIAQRHKSAS